MTASRRRHRWAALRERPDEGRIGILLIGFVAVVILLVTGVVGVTAVQISRIQLLDAADAAALDAADSVARDDLYDGGLGEGLPLTDVGVSDAAATHLAGRERPGGIDGWSLQPGTGTPDGRTAVVVLSGRARIPVISSVLDVFGGSVTVTVSTSARSDLEGGP